MTAATQSRALDAPACDLDYISTDIYISFLISLQISHVLRGAGKKQ
jgi:hypothetical protein